MPDPALGPVSEDVNLVWFNDPDMEHEIFHDHATGLLYDITRAKAIVARYHNRPTLPLPTTSPPDADLDPAHVALADPTVPGIAIKGRGIDVTIIDGRHRYRRAYEMGRSVFHVIYLGPDEEAECCCGLLPTVTSTAAALRPLLTRMAAYDYHRAYGADAHPDQTAAVVARILATAGVEEE